MLVHMQKTQEKQARAANKSLKDNLGDYMNGSDSEEDVYGSESDDEETSSNEDGISKEDNADNQMEDENMGDEEHKASDEKVDTTEMVMEDFETKVSHQHL